MPAERRADLEKALFDKQLADSGAEPDNAATSLVVRARRRFATHDIPVRSECIGKLVNVRSCPLQGAARC